MLSDPVQEVLRNLPFPANTGEMQELGPSKGRRTCGQLPSERLHIETFRELLQLGQMLMKPKATLSEHLGHSHTLLSTT